MTAITLDSTFEEVLALIPQAVEIIAEHGCKIDEECAEDIRTLSLETCEYMCHLDDMDGLLAKLNAALPRA